jgi:hypothetical protein
MTTDIAIVPADPVSVFGTDEPTGIVTRTRDIAQALGQEIKEAGLSSTISGREYVRVEGWAYLGTMLGVFPRTVSVQELRDEIDGEDRIVGFEAHVELVARDGAIVGGAIAECTRGESNWRERDAFALKSMAQTRAVGKAFRMSFGFVMASAGYEATPAEEMMLDIPSRDIREDVTEGEYVHRRVLDPGEACEHGVMRSAVDAQWSAMKTEAAACGCCGKPCPIGSEFCNVCVTR